MANVKIVFKISRFNERKNILTMMERFNHKKNAVTSMARVMFEYNFISGLHLAFVDERGNAEFSFDRKEEAKEIRQNFNISLTEEITEQLFADVKAISALVKPPKDNLGVSQLTKYQLHVELKTNKLEKSFSKEKSVTFKVKSHQVAKVHIVTKDDPAYVFTQESFEVDLNLIMKSISEKRKVRELKAPTKESEVKDFLKTLSRSQKRAAKRESYKKSIKAATKSLYATSKTISLSNQTEFAAIEEELE